MFCFFSTGLLLLYFFYFFFLLGGMCKRVWDAAIFSFFVLTRMRDNFLDGEKGRENTHAHTHTWGCALLCTQKCTKSAPHDAGARTRRAMRPRGGGRFHPARSMSATI